MKIYLQSIVKFYPGMTKYKALLNKFLFYAVKAYIHTQGETMILPHSLKPANPNAATAILVPNGFTRYINSDAIWLREYVLALVRRNKSLNIVSSAEEVYPKQLVIWRPSEKWVQRRWRYSSKVSSTLAETARLIERRGAVIMPNSKVISYYENKVNMHDMFKREGVRSPATFAVNTMDEYIDASKKIGLPFIIKGAYGFSSSHIYLVDNDNDAYNFGKQIFLAPGSKTQDESTNSFQMPVLVQEYLNIRRDMRVIFVGKKIFISYWRINTSTSWKSTATSFGSKVIYESFPAHWLNFLMDVINKINFPWGGLDIAWNNDDFSCEPYVLEVSPCFEPNPPPPAEFGDNYYQFKYQSKHIYNLRIWETIRGISDAQVGYMLEQGCSENSNHL